MLLKKFEILIEGKKYLERLLIMFFIIGSSPNLMA
jgi:hypothetical protein